MRDNKLINHDTISLRSLVSALSIKFKKQMKMQSCNTPLIESPKIRAKSFSTIYQLRYFPLALFNHHHNILMVNKQNLYLKCCASFIYFFIYLMLEMVNLNYLATTIITN